MDPWTVTAPQGGPTQAHSTQPWTISPPARPGKENALEPGKRRGVAPIPFTPPPNPETVFPGVLVPRPTRLPQRVFGPVITNISPNIIKALSMQGAALVVIHNDPTDLPPDRGDK